MNKLQAPGYGRCYTSQKRYFYEFQLNFSSDKILPKHGDIIGLKMNLLLD